MNNSYEIKALATAANSKFSYYRSFVNVDRSVIKPLFFYHVPKCGGMSFHTAISWGSTNLADTLKAQNITEVLPAVSRADEINELKALKHNFFYLISSHLPFGAHLLPQVSDFELMTVFRDPVSRLKSAYTYMCMRSDIKPSLAGFSEFFKRDENINVYCKQLHPNAITETIVDPDAVMLNLENNFTCYGTIDSLDAIIEFYLSKFNLLNVLQGQINPTLSQFKIDLSEFDDEIKQLNYADDILYQRVLAAPRIPEIYAANDSISQFSSVVMQNQTIDGSKSTGVAVKTGGLINKLQKISDNKFSAQDLLMLNFFDIVGDNPFIQR